MQAARADWFLANMIGNTGCAVSTGLIKSGQNYSRHSQQRIDTLIMMNGNRIIFSPDIVIALSHFCSSCSCFSDPPSPSHCSPAIVSASAFWPHFLFFKPVHFSPSGLNPTHPSRKSWEEQQPRLSAPVIWVCCKTKGGSSRNSQKQSSTDVHLQ